MYLYICYRILWFLFHIPQGNVVAVYTRETKGVARARDEMRVNANENYFAAWNNMCIYFLSSSTHLAKSNFFKKIYQFHIYKYK